MVTEKQKIIIVSVIKHQEENMQDQSIYEKLKEYAKSDAYPFHMPGHKRKVDWISNVYDIDITEIDGFDDLHHADGILEE